MNRAVVAIAYVDVYELSVSCPPYLGLDQTDAGRKGHTVKDATLVTDPKYVGLDDNAVTWTACGELCEFKDENGVAKSKGEKVNYRNKGADNASKSLNAEPLTTKVSIPGAEDVYCTTNFTVVKVDVSIGGTGEGGDETAPQNVIYSRELTKFAIDNMMPVKVTCEPKSLPGMELVWLTLPDNGELFELGEDGTAKSAKPYYRYNEIGGKSFGLLGRPVPTETADGWAPKFKGGYVVVDHYSSGAKDKGAFKVVPPPPLEITVNFSSPSGNWPYDPVWDNPDYEPTVTGKKAEWCADHPGEAKVAYRLSRDAADIKGKIYKGCGWYTSDDIVDSLKDMLPVKGVHISKWSLPKDLDIGTYYAKVTAVEGETGEERTAKSNEGELKRVCYYRSGASDDMNIPSKWLTDAEVDGLKDGLDAVSTSGDIATAKLPWWMSALISTAKFLGIGSVDIPKWFTSGTEIRQCAWTVRKLEWNGESYELGSGSSQLIGENGECMVVYPEFEMRYVKIGRPCGTNSGFRIDWSSLFLCKEIAMYGGRTIGYSVDGLSSVIYPETSKEWKWEPKPGGGHGLLCPECCKENKED